MGLGLCKADVESFDAGRKLCLLPTPELKRQARRSSRSLPNSSPRSLQLSFSERVAKASLCLSSDSEEDDVTGKLSSPLFSPTRTEAKEIRRRWLGAGACVPAHRHLHFCKVRHADVGAWAGLEQTVGMAVPGSLVLCARRWRGGRRAHSFCWKVSFQDLWDHRH
eukprot:s3361_g2.t1